MKILFLDVDGVLNCKGSGTPIGTLDPDKVGLLLKILSKTGAKIVLTSTWRTSRDHMNLLFHAISPGYFVGSTPYISAVGKRKEEILKWLQNIYPYSYGTTGKIEVLAVIDDDISADLGEGSYFRTYMEFGGLTEEIAARVISHLGEIEV